MSARVRKGMTRVNGCDVHISLHFNDSILRRNILTCCSSPRLPELPGQTMGKLPLVKQDDTVRPASSATSSPPEPLSRPGRLDPPVMAVVRSGDDTRARPTDKSRRVATDCATSAGPVQSSPPDH